jgi:hypothetical protein
VRLLKPHVRKVFSLTTHLTECTNRQNGDWIVHRHKACKDAEASLKACPRGKGCRAANPEDVREPANYADAWQTTIQAVEFA